jgi:hypothetical protein
MKQYLQDKSTYRTHRQYGDVGSTFEACRMAGNVAVSARQLKPIEKLMLKLTTKSQIEFGKARY